MGVCLCAAVRFGSSPLVVPRLPGVHAPHTCLRAHGCITHRLYPMRVAGHLTIRDCSSTQIPLPSLSATTLTTEQMPSHNHVFSEVLYNAGSDCGVTAQHCSWTTSHYYKNLLDYMLNTGGSSSHTHAVINPVHNHAATTEFAVIQASRALHYIMRCA